MRGCSYTACRVYERNHMRRLLPLLLAAALFTVVVPQTAQAHTVARGLADAVTFDFTAWTTTRPPCCTRWRPS